MREVLQSLHAAQHQGLEGLSRQEREKSSLVGYVGALGEHFRVSPGLF